MRRLERLIQGGLLILLAIMPFHAFLTVWLGTTVGHRTLIQSWKELLLVSLGVLTLVLVIRQPHRLERLRRPGLMALGMFVGLALLVTAAAHPPALTALFGFKTDIEFIVGGIIAILVSTPILVRRAVRVTLVAGSIVVVFGLCQIFFLPPDFLAQFGYGPATIVPFQTIDATVHSLRFGATLGGPNQLGAYLTIVIALSLAVALRYRHWWWLLLTGGSGLVLVHTYSRAAWIGAVAAVILVLLGSLPQRWRRAGLITSGLLIAFSLAALPVLLQDSSLNHYLLHGGDQYQNQRGSDYEHLASLQDGTTAVLAQPWGHGLGTAGPTVFHTGSGRIIENYYLQIGYETGLLGMILFTGGVMVCCWYLVRRPTSQPVGIALAGAFVGLSANALVLPVWTDSTTGLVAWIMLGAVLGSHTTEDHHV